MANTLKFGNGQWATGNGTALAYNDENANFKPLPFDFTRASSATVVNQQGLIETVGSGLPRIDFQGNTKGALLLEPSRTNSFPYSENISVFASASNGTGTNPVITSNYSVSPDGTQNADRIQFNRGSGTSSSDTSYVTYGLSLGTIDATLSIYLKTNDGTTKDVTLRLGTSLFDYDVTVTSNWQRFTLSGNTNVDRVQILLYGNQNSQTADISCYGVQLEQGSYATSYIPTSGSAVTRVVDVCNNGGNAQVINSTEGTLYVEANLINGYDNNNWLGIIYDSSNANNRIYIQRYLGNIQGGIRVNGVIQSEITQSSSSLGKNKIAFTYKLNEFKMFVNGSQVGVTDTSGSVFSFNTLDVLNVGVYHNNTLQFNSGIDDVKLYNTALTDNELAALTQV